MWICFASAKYASADLYPAFHSIALSSLSVLEVSGNVVVPSVMSSKICMTKFARDSLGALEDDERNWLSNSLRSLSLLSNLFTSSLMWCSLDFRPLFFFSLEDFGGLNLGRMNPPLTAGGSESMWAEKSQKGPLINFRSCEVGLLHRLLSKDPLCGEVCFAFGESRAQGGLISSMSVLSSAAFASRSSSSAFTCSSV